MRLVAGISSIASLLFGCFSGSAGEAQENRTETVKPTGGKLGIEMILVPGGKFSMGSPANEAGRDADEPEPVEVEVKPFWMGKHEITWEQYELFWYNKEKGRIDGKTHPSEPYEPPDGGMGTGKHSAVNIRWQAAKVYCEWLSQKTGKKFRLPTEVEWEYACRAGSKTPAPDPLGDHAWYIENSKTESHENGKVHEVGLKKPNAFGFHDMLGNVWEWCNDPYDPKDNQVPVARGGSWIDPAKELRAANRQKLHPDWYERDPNRPRSVWWLTDALMVGFRVVREVEPGEK